jgi:hypothetical protein
VSRELVYESDRLFSLFGYAISHGLLLLRSGKADETPTTRVDILFRDVRAMEIRAWLKGIRIEEVDDPRFLDGQRSNPAAMIEPGHRIYSLTSPGSPGWGVVGQSTGWQGFIVGGIVQVKEDDGELFGPSALVLEPPVIERWTLG